MKLKSWHGHYGVKLKFEFGRCNQEMWSVRYVPKESRDKTKDEPMNVNADGTM